MDTRSIIAPLGSAANNLGAIARKLGAAGTRLSNSRREEQLRKQLVSAAESLRNAAFESATMMRAAAAPYARELAASAEAKLASLQEDLSAGIDAAATKLRRPNTVTRHPYASIAVLASTVFIAVRQWRRRKIARATQQPAKKGATARKTARTKSNAAPLRASSRSNRAANGKAIPAKAGVH